MTKTLQRLKGKGLFCGMDYVNIDMIKPREYYSRFNHSMNVAYTAWKLSYDLKVTLTGLFHDVGKFMLKGEIDNHEIIGAEYAEDFLRENNYEETKIQLIKHAIMNHRKNANDDFDQMSKLIINSDIISYILHKKYFFEYLLKFTNQDEANQTVNKKISDSYARMDDDGKRLIFDLLIKSI